MGLDSLIPTEPRWSGTRDWDAHWMRHAVLNAEMSTCLSRQTGAVIVNAKRLISAGFNGNVPGARHCVDGGCARCQARTSADVTVHVPEGQALHLCTCVHAEANAIAQCARLYGGASGSTIYTTHRPCLDCVKLIAVAGIVRVFYAEDYPATYEIPPTIEMMRLA